MDSVKGVQERSFKRIVVDDDGNKILHWHLEQCNSIFDAAFEFRECILFNACDLFANVICKGKYVNRLLTTKSELLEGINIDIRPFYVEFVYKFDESASTKGFINVTLYEQDNGNYLPKWTGNLKVIMSEDEWNNILQFLIHFYNDMIFARSPKSY